MKKIRTGLKIFVLYPKTTCLCVVYIFISIQFIVKTSQKNETLVAGKKLIRNENYFARQKEKKFSIHLMGGKESITNRFKCDMSSYIARDSDLCYTVLSKGSNSLYTIKRKESEQSHHKLKMSEVYRRNIPEGYLKSRENNCYIDEVIQNCEILRDSFMYGKHNPSTEETLYPIAFAMKIHTHANQAHRLLRYIYYKHNIYCIHIDGKAEIDIFNKFKLIEKCFDNIIVIEDRVRVVYSTIRVVQAELKCMNALFRSTTKWKYYINLTGEEFMLKTNAEIVKILKILNGTNDIESYPVPLAEYHKFKQRTLIINEKPIVTRHKKPVFQQNINIQKGSAYGLFSREFINFVLKDEFVKEFLVWLKDTYAPEELIWPTLQVLPGTPGGRPNSMLTKDKYYISRAVKWQMDPTVTCHGKFVHWICIYGLEDLSWLLSNKNIVANKFYEEFDPLALNCIEKIMYARLVGGISENFDLSMYRH